jgi:carbon storage regulator
MIGDDVEITVVDIRGDKVRLGINAPRSIQVHRKEVYEAIQSENAQASRLRLADLDGAAAGVGPRNGRPRRPGVTPTRPDR